MSSTVTNQAPSTAYSYNQQAFTTADIERILYGNQGAVVESPPEPIQVTYVVAAGELFLIDYKSIPPEWPALSDQSGLAQLALK